jgi:hypothetical protein
MADSICPTDRALIAQALAEGRVTRVPRGVSGLPGYVCDPQTGKLVSEAGAAWKDVAKARGMRRSARIRRLQAAVPASPVADATAVQEQGGASKADRLRALLLAGHAPPVIAVSVGVATSYVYAIRKELRESGALPPPQRRDFAALRRHALALADSGLTLAQIAERLGTARAAVGGLVTRAKAERDRARDAT